MSRALEIQRVICEERKKQGITYRKFAKMIGCDPRTITYWKNEESTITIDMADKALKALGLTITIGK